MRFVIRLASRDDEPQVQAVVKAVYDEYGFTWDPASYHADLYNLDEHYFDQGYLFWVAERDDRVVGVVAYQLHDPIPGEPGFVHSLNGTVRVNGTDCSLERLYVHPSARRQGLGGTLFRAVLRKAREDGNCGMEIWSDKRFGDAHRLYERFGATLVGERICDDPDESPEWGLFLSLVDPQREVGPIGSTERSLR